MTSLGAWVGDNLRRTTQANLGIGADSDLPQDVRFVAGVAKLIRRRIAEQGACADPKRLAIFLLEPNATAQGPDSPKRVPMLDNGLTMVTGRLWFVSSVVVSGRYIDFNFEDGDDAYFRMVTETLNLGDVPAIVFDPRTNPPDARFYPRGLGDIDNLESVALTSNVSVGRIYEAIDLVYRNCLITPEAQDPTGKLWKNGRRWFPSCQAERTIQFYLRVGLTTAFPTCVVRREQTSVSGRFDLQIEENSTFGPGHVTRHAILELKVVRSFWSSGTQVPHKDMLDSVKSGVEQAASYRSDFNAREAVLCCFDMRQKHSGRQCFNHVEGLAAQLSVELMHWFIFGTSKQYRDFLTSKI